MLRLHNWISKQDPHGLTDELVTDTLLWFKTLSDQDLIEILMTGFIPEYYEENKEQEKMFAKAIEVLVAEIFERIGFRTTIRKTKSESEDVQAEHNLKSILIDTKTFRLGRSQIAPNVKDFVKLSTVQKWISNYNRTEIANAIGALVVYPSTHEWKKQSEAYKECSNKQVPIVMLPFELLSYFLQEKNSFTPNELFSLWNYQTIFPTTIKTRQSYWANILPVVAQIVKRSVKEVEQELEIFRLYYTESIQETQKYLNQKIEETTNRIPQQIKRMTEEEVRLTLQHLLIQIETSSLLQSIQNIHKNRKDFLSIA